MKPGSLPQAGRTTGVRIDLKMVAHGLAGKGRGAMIRKSYEAPVLRKAGKLSSVTASKGVSGPNGPAG